MPTVETVMQSNGFDLFNHWLQAGSNIQPPARGFVPTCAAARRRDEWVKTSRS